MKPCLVQDPAEFGKVAVLMGGLAAEREISIKSGNAVFAALQDKSVNVAAIDVNDSLINALQGQTFDRVFNIIHGMRNQNNRTSFF